ncbi:MAG: hypothetical protein QM736_21100 [Vicinamibacterales bacterium]
MPHHSSRAGAPFLLRAARIVLFLGLAWFYVTAAGAHATRMNVMKSRGDQTGYLVDAKRVYANWHGQSPAYLIGERMRMPVYAGVLALAYSPTLTDDDFWLVARRVNIWLSLALLVVLGIVFARFLPPLVSTNLTVIVAFGYFVFKAGYSQPELLFYTLFFLTFLTLCVLLEEHRPVACLALATLGGVLAGVTHLTKAVMPPFLGVYAAVFLFAEWMARRERRETARTRLIALGMLGAVFLVVVSPYIVTSKRLFGEYFFNHNTTYYIWFDTGAQARAIMLSHTNADGLVDLPADQLPSMSSYLRTRSAADIATRFTDGFTDMVVRSYTTFWYYPYALLFLGAAAAAFWIDRSESIRIVRRHWALVVFLALYAVAFLLSTAFFSTISGTGTTRFLLAHVTPLFFALSVFLARDRFRYFHVFVSLLLTFDLVFTIWPRLMTTYGGF